MNNFSKQSVSKKSIVTFLIFVFVLISNVSAYSQIVENTASGIITTESEGSMKQEKVKDSNMEFVLWFMGSKQDPNSTISTEGINTKRQIMTSGLAPNRLLMKAFLKKAVNFESTLV